jgi:fructosamine-3-kinase
MPWLDKPSARHCVTPDVRRRAEAALGSRIRRSQPLSGGNIAQATRIETDDGRDLVVKHMVPRRQSPHPTFGTLPKATLKDEAFMLDRLRQTGVVPVPDVVHVAPDLLILTFVDCDQDALSNTGQTALADVLAALHAHTAPRFGFDRPTPVGPVQRPNAWSEDWLSFLRDQRLMFFGHLAQQAGRLPDGCFAGLEKLCTQLDRWIPMNRPPSLIHGDLWIGNILFRQQRLAALIDPATYYADAEIELAFLPLFSGVGAAFFERYHAHRPIDPLFFEERQMLYQLEPLLAHAMFFGGGYGTRVHQIVRHYGG